LKDWGERNQIHADLQAMATTEERLPTPVETALFRILQEALNNTLRHANATRVDVVLDRKSDEVRLIVEDNGQGFQTEAVQNRRVGERGLGLLGMRERATAVGGALAIESEPGKGTSVYVQIPLKEAGE
jgi:signal transduction histidine kinase